MLNYSVKTQPLNLVKPWWIDEDSVIVGIAARFMDSIERV
jgi:hypothetical protein